MNVEALTWVKSSYSSGEGGECVEVAVTSGAVHVRDSKDTSRPVLTVKPATWTGFIERMEL
ncbi:DUF397 domain-containing protein [Streptomyces sp. NPDC086549]|uniref:DUF397 domain-containing protein n=1 Tax=Streptomyces sp. NPDC086549 TaxID=3365752 RepID=UPI0037FE182F